MEKGHKVTDLLGEGNPRLKKKDLKYFRARVAMKEWGKASNNGELKDKKRYSLKKANLGEGEGRLGFVSAPGRGGGSVCGENRENRVIIWDGQRPH